MTLTDPLPAGVTFATCVSNAGGVCGGSGNNRTVTFASIPGLGSATVTITATVTAGMGATLVNTATVTSSTFDAVLANNTATATSHTPGVNPSDTDNDALPNDWETRYGLDPNSGAGVNGAGGDPDGDGRTNFQELTEGSHPRGFVITYLAEGATGHVLRHAHRPGQPHGDCRPRAGPLPEGRRHRRVGLRGRCCRSAG